MFQFYDSPIKSHPRGWGYPKKSLFQFYDSPIKRQDLDYEDKRSRYSFNSMIVRLKAGEKWVYITDFKTFQFYDSPIKRANKATIGFEPSARFNSMIVRLKGLLRGR